MSRKFTLEEIEKQYREYKEQFDRWKECNKQAIGTEAYNKYVSDFQTWEKEVEKRKQEIKNSRPVEQTEDAAARAYAAQQEHYFRMHQKGIQEDIRNKMAPKRTSGVMNSPHTPSNRDVQSALSSLTNALTNAIKTSGSRSPADALKPVGQSNSATTISAPPLLASQAPVQQTQPQSEAVKPPQYWWVTKPAYGQQDKMYKMFGNLAAPTTTKVPLNSETYNPGWLVQREMAKQNLKFFDPSMEVTMVPLNMMNESPLPPPKLAKVPDIPTSFNVPPPFLPLNVPPPMINQPPPRIQRPPPPLNGNPLLAFDPSVPPPPLPNQVMLPNSIQGGLRKNLSFPGQQPMPIHG